MNLKTIIFIGRSGCGKGTQVEEIKKYFSTLDYRNVFHLEAGDKFRQFIEGSTYASKLSRQIYETGSLQPEFLSVWAWADKLNQDFEEDQHLLIDGTPRRLSEARILDSALTFFERPEVDIVYINVSRNWAIERMQQRGRSDDRELSDIIARLDWFDTDVVPALDFYRAHKSHHFHEINGEQEIGKVHEDIVKSLGL